METHTKNLIHSQEIVLPEWIIYEGEYKYLYSVENRYKEEYFSYFYACFIQQALQIEEALSDDFLEANLVFSENYSEMPRFLLKMFTRELNEKYLSEFEEYPLSLELIELMSLCLADNPEETTETTLQTVPA